MDSQNTQATPAPGADAAGGVDVDAMLAKIDVPPQLLNVYQRALLSGMRIMFDSKSHTMMLDELKKPGPLAQKLVEGIVALIYMLWKQSNQTLPPKIILPLTVALALKAFDYLQRSGEPEATKDVLGQALEGVIPAIMKKFGAKPGQGAAPASPDVPGAAAPTPDATQGAAQ